MYNKLPLKKSAVFDKTKRIRGLEMEIVIVEITIPEGLNSYVHEFNVAPQKSFLR
jgi:hypothetical protein